MSIDWSVHLRPVRFTVRELLDKTQSTLATVLGQRTPTLVTESTAGGVLDTRCGTNHPGFIVALPGDSPCKASVAFVKLTEDDSGELREHDEYLLVSPWRNSTSYVLAIGIAIAAALLADNPVRDDPPVLGEELEHDPSALIAALAVNVGGSLEEAAAAVLSRTKLHG